MEQYKPLVKKNKSLKEYLEKVKKSKLYNNNWLLRGKNDELEKGICEVKEARDQLREEHDRLDSEISLVKAQVKKEQTLKS